MYLQRHLWYTDLTLDTDLGPDTPAITTPGANPGHTPSFSFLGPTVRPCIHITQTDRHRQTDTDGPTQTDRHRQTDTHTHTPTHTHTHTHTLLIRKFLPFLLGLAIVLRLLRVT